MRIFNFLNEVKQEINQVKWSDFRSVAMGSIMVLTVILCVSIFLLLVDSVIQMCIRYLINAW